MMAKIVHHRHAPGDAAHFHAALDAFESVEAGLNLLVGQAAMLGAGHHRQGVAHVEFPHQVEMKLEARNLKFARRRAVAQVEAVDAVVRAQPKAFDRAMRHVEQRRQVRIVPVGQKLAVARNQVDQPPEGRLHRGEVLEYVRVIEFQIVD